MKEFTYRLIPLWGTKGEETSVTVSMKSEGSVVMLKYDVYEKELRRMVREDKGKVWTDSCVEFFASNGKEYVNFEFSASGALLAAIGDGRANRKYLPEEIYSSTARKVTILENNNKTSHWVLETQIDLMKAGLIKALPSTISFNLYKCGDELERPHHLAAFPIDLPRPDFHSPQFFKELVLE